MIYKHYYYFQNLKIFFHALKEQEKEKNTVIIIPKTVPYTQTRNRKKKVIKLKNNNNNASFKMIKMINSLIYVTKKIYDKMKFYATLVKHHQ